MIVCDECGNEFTQKHKNEKLCSNECRNIRYKRLRQEWSKRNPDKRAKQRKRSSERRRIMGKQKLYSYKYRSTKAGYVTRFIERVKRYTEDSDIDRSFLLSIMEDDCCMLTGIKFDYGDGNPKGRYLSPYAPSLDRIDSQLGYYRHNVQVVLQAINFAKNDMSMVEFLDVWSNILKNWENCKKIIEEEKEKSE